MLAAGDSDRKTTLEPNIMTQIKIQKALQILEASLTSGGHVLYETAHKAIEIAETEAVEHYAKELEVLKQDRDKYKAFYKTCQSAIETSKVEK